MQVVNYVQQDGFKPLQTLGNFRSEEEDDYEYHYEFSVLSMCTSKNVGPQSFFFIEFVARTK